MTTLIAGGDSFTYGNELADCTLNRFSEKTWSGILADQLGMSYDCTAWGGNGNSAIARRTMTACHKHLALGHDIFVSVMWSWPTRYEFRFRYDTHEHESPWCTITPWTHERDQNVILDAFKNFKETVFDHYKRNQLTAQTTGIADFSEHFFKDVGDSEYWELYTSIKEMVFLQDWLKQRNIDYLFTYVDDCLFKHNTPLDSTLKTLYDSLDLDKIYLPDQFEGFYKWAMDNNYPLGATHPLEEAHEDFKSMILPFINQFMI